jgi:hypothetical protein
MFVSQFIVLLADSILQQMEKGIEGRVRIKDAQPLCFWIEFRLAPPHLVSLFAQMRRQVIASKLDVSVTSDRNRRSFRLLDKRCPTSMFLDRFRLAPPHWSLCLLR